MTVFGRFQTRSIRYLLKVVFVTIISSFSIISLVSLLYMQRMALEYNRQISNIEFANNVSRIVKEDIGRENWYLVAGRISLEQSKQFETLESVEAALSALRESTAADAGREYIEAAIRATGTLRQYVEQLSEQIAIGAPVSGAEGTLAEINKVAGNIYDVLQEFTYAQINAIGVDNDTMQRASRWMTISILALIFAAIVVAVMAYRTLKRAADRPGVELAAMTERIMRGDLETQVPPPGLEELNAVAAGINLMSERIRALLNQNIQEQKNLQKAEIRALQAQITPHFLYNTLDTIVWLAECGYNEEVVEVAMAFSNFYRIMLSSGRDFITVGEEVQHVREYLVIQGVRYQDILHYEIDVEERLKERRMLKLLLQPIVENALYHGVKNKRGGVGHIRVTGRLQEDASMRFTVEDNGMGMKEVELVRLQTGIAAEKPPESSGYGLYNVNRRLRLYYGASDLLIESVYGEGARVTFCLPVREDMAE
jgi:two-component system sensor histidine kinase YesM